MSLVGFNVLTVCSRAIASRRPTDFSRVGDFDNVLVLAAYSDPRVASFLGSDGYEDKPARFPSNGSKSARGRKDTSNDNTDAH